MTCQRPAQSDVGICLSSSSGTSGQLRVLHAHCSALFHGNHSNERELSGTQLPNRCTFSRQVKSSHAHNMCRQNTENAHSKFPHDPCDARAGTFPWDFLFGGSHLCPYETLGHTSDRGHKKKTINTANLWETSECQISSVISDKTVLHFKHRLGKAPC